MTKAIGYSLALSCNLVLIVVVLTLYTHKHTLWIIGYDPFIVILYNLQFVMYVLIQWSATVGTIEHDVQLEKEEKTIWELNVCCWSFMRDNKVQHDLLNNMLGAVLQKVYWRTVSTVSHSVTGYVRVAIHAELHPQLWLTVEIDYLDIYPVI